MYYVYHQIVDEPFEYCLWGKTGYESFTYAADAWYAWLEETKGRIDISDRQKIVIICFPGDFIPPKFLSKRKS